MLLDLALNLSAHTYDSAGNVLSESSWRQRTPPAATGSQALSAVLVGAPQVKTYTYDFRGQVLTVSGPRTDGADTLTYTYDADANLASISNVLGHTTRLSQYDANGRAGRIDAPNGLMTTLRYSTRGQLLESTLSDGVAAQRTAYSYDGVGQLVAVTLPDNATISYVYDGAHRLTGVADGLGNSIAYTLDASGNRIGEKNLDAGGVLVRQIARAYDTLNRLQSVTGSAQ